MFLLLSILTLMIAGTPLTKSASGGKGVAKSGRFSVQDHLLLKDGVHVKQIPGVENYSKDSEGAARVNKDQFVVMHYTASEGTAEEQTRFCTERGVSWHLTVDRSGHVVQLLDFTKVAWHAGVSSWRCEGGEDFKSLNYFSIGIEMVNYGWLTEKEGKYYSWNDVEIPLEEVYFDGTNRPWTAYTEVQKEVTMDIALSLAEHYNVKAIVGHEDISPGRKEDPGAAYPLEELKKAYQATSHSACQSSVSTL